MIGWRDYITLPALAARLPEGLPDDRLAGDTGRVERILHPLRLLPPHPRSAQTPPLVEEAEAAYREALKMAHEMGMRPLIAWYHQGLGLVYRRMGKRKKVREHLTTATRMYRET